MIFHGAALVPKINSSSGRGKRGLAERGHFSRSDRLAAEDGDRSVEVTIEFRAICLSGFPGCSQIQFQRPRNADYVIRLILLCTTVGYYLRRVATVGILLKF